MASYSAVPEFPKLAWLARVSRDTLDMRVLHGLGVETHARFFVEGVWDGPFDEGCFADTACFFGSGAVIRRHELIFVSAADTVDSLFYAVDDAHCRVSNSLPLLLAALDDALDPAESGYAAALDSVLKGIHEYVSELPTEKGRVDRLIHKNLRISAAGIELVDKPLPGRFDGYDAYLAYLERNLRAIHSNLRSPDRRVRLDLISTQSRGYDTTAINAIAAPLGLDKVFSCTSSRDKHAFVTREKTGQPSDDGTLIGQALGFSCVPIDRQAFRRHFPDETLYYAGHYAAQDVNLREINDRLERVSVLLTGVRGEIWYGNEFYRSVMSASDSLSKFDMAGHGLAEVRLHAGIIHVPVPFLGARRQDDIHAITRSADMDPWRLNKTYDRPIPRRMAEDKGVPRALFGQLKLNTTVAFPKPAVPYDKTIRREFFRFLTSNRLLHRWQIPLIPWVHLVNQVLHYKSPKRYRLVYFCERLLARIVRRPLEIPLLWSRLNSSLYCFSVNQVRESYASALRDCGNRSTASHGTCPTRDDREHTADATDAGAGPVEGSTENNDVAQKQRRRASRLRSS